MHTKTYKTRDLDLWPMTLIFNRLLEVVKVHVHAKFHQAKCSGSWVIVLTEKNLATMLKTILPWLTIVTIWRAPGSVDCLASVGWSWWCDHWHYCTFGCLLPLQRNNTLTLRCVCQVAGTFESSKRFYFNSDCSHNYICHRSCISAPPSFYSCIFRFP